MHILKSPHYFDKKYSLLKRENATIETKLIKTLKLLSADPFYPSLKTHKVNTRLLGEKYSSRVTGDIRLIWEFDSNDAIIILLLDIGGHTGKHKVYQ